MMLRHSTRKGTRMKKLLEQSLIANAASLGYHWIYDAEYLETKAKQGSLLFGTPNPEDYLKAKEAYFAYPSATLGDVSVQGSMMLWLYHGLQENPSLTVEDYHELLYDHFKPGGAYQGYVESYAQRWLAQKLATENEQAHFPSPIHDDHLVGFMPYLVTKALGLGLDLAWQFAQTFTQDKHYLAYYQMFEFYFDLVSSKTHKEAIKEALSQVPSEHRAVFEAALEMKETEAFVSLYHLRTCAYAQALPIIIHLAYHATSLEEALEKNMTIGGNLCDRATYLCALLTPVFPMPHAWKDKVQLNFMKKGPTR